MNDDDEAIPKNCEWAWRTRTPPTTSPTSKHPTGKETESRLAARPQSRRWMTHAALHFRLCTCLSTSSILHIPPPFLSSKTSMMRERVPRIDVLDTIGLV